jgi:hypothetical protein
MTPKEKAINLFNRYVNLLPTGSNVERAKQGALVAIYEIIDKDGYNNDYWQEVKQELEKL